MRCIIVRHLGLAAVTVYRFAFAKAKPIDVRRYTAAFQSLARGCQCLERIRPGVLNAQRPRQSLQVPESTRRHKQDVDIHGLGPRRGRPVGPRALPGIEVERAFALLQCAALHGVRVDHRRLHVGVAEHLLDGPDVVVGPEQVAGEAVSERVVTRFAKRALRTADRKAFCKCDS